MMSSYKVKAKNTVIQQTVAVAPFNENKNRDNQLEKSSRIRTSFTDEQLTGLEREFDKNIYLPREFRNEISTRLGLTEKHVKVWFQNRRAKCKKLGNDKNEFLKTLTKKKNVKKPLVCTSNQYSNQHQNHQQKDQQLSIQRQQKQQIPQMSVTVDQRKPYCHHINTIIPSPPIVHQRKQQLYAFMPPSQHLYRMPIQYRMQHCYHRSGYPYQYRYSFPQKEPFMQTFPEYAYQQHQQFYYNQPHIKQQTPQEFSPNLQRHQLQPIFEEISVKLEPIDLTSDSEFGSTNSEKE